MEFVVILYVFNSNLIIFFMILAMKYPICDIKIKCQHEHSFCHLMSCEMCVHSEYKVWCGVCKCTSVTTICI